MTSYLSQCLINTTDTDKAVAFYRDALGLSVVNDVANGEHRWVTLASARPDAPQIVLNPVAGVPMSEEDRRSIESLLVKGVLGMYIFATDDLDAAFQRAKEAGAEIVQEIAEQPWGAKDCSLRDPSGNLIRLNQA